MKFSMIGGEEEKNVGDDLVVLLYHLQHACKRIASLVASPFNSSLGKLSVNSSSGSDRDAPKPLDIVSVCVFLYSHFFHDSIHIKISILQFMFCFAERYRLVLS